MLRDEEGLGFPRHRRQAFKRQGCQTAISKLAEISGHRSLAALERYLDQDAAREKAEAARSLLVG